jgi:hypothetical protein
MRHPLGYLTLEEPLTGQITLTGSASGRGLLKREHRLACRHAAQHSLATSSTPFFPLSHFSDSQLHPNSKMTTRHPAELNSGIRTSWLPVTTAWTS